MLTAPGVRLRGGRPLCGALFLPPAAARLVRQYRVVGVKPVVAAPLGLVAAPPAGHTVHTVGRDTAQLISVSNLAPQGAVYTAGCPGPRVQRCGWQRRECALGQANSLHGHGHGPSPIEWGQAAKPVGLCRSGPTVCSLGSHSPLTFEWKERSA